MADWEWVVMLALWAWLMADLHLLRRDLDATVRFIDQRRIDAVRKVQADVDAIERKLQPRW